MIQDETLLEGLEELGVGGAVSVEMIEQGRARVPVLEQFRGGDVHGAVHQLREVGAEIALAGERSFAQISSVPQPALPEDFGQNVRAAGVVGRQQLQVLAKDPDRAQTWVKTVDILTGGDDGDRRARRL